ncbi:MAG TPA: DinB family protein, partial [Methylomirabilota bacterium]|nr:DinB family protein [Methylomirabilota bacterium]
MAPDHALTVARLTATPAMLRELSSRCPPEQAWTPPAPGQWSVAEVVRHLVEGDRDTFLPRLRRMLAEPRPVFASVRPTPGDSADLPTLLATFADTRRQVVAILGGLDAAGWARDGVSPSR